MLAASCALPIPCFPTQPHSRSRPPRPWPPWRRRWRACGRRCWPGCRACCKGRSRHDEATSICFLLHQDSQHQQTARASVRETQRPTSHPRTTSPCRPSLERPPAPRSRPQWPHAARRATRPRRPTVTAPPVHPWLARLRMRCVAYSLGTRVGGLKAATGGRATGGPIGTVPKIWFPSPVPAVHERQGWRARVAASANVDSRRSNASVCAALCHFAACCHRRPPWRGHRLRAGR